MGGTPVAPSRHVALPPTPDQLLREIEDAPPPRQRIEARLTTDAGRSADDGDVQCSDNQWRHCADQPHHRRCRSGGGSSSVAEAAAAAIPSPHDTTSTSTRKDIFRGAMEEMTRAVHGTDGHMWLKYGQKQLARFPSTIRCYYRCASYFSSKCAMKKTVDMDMRRPLSPATVTIAYSGGSHNHPQPPHDLLQGQQQVECPDNSAASVREDGGEEAGKCLATSSAQRLTNHHTAITAVCASSFQPTDITGTSGCSIS
ncbi:unnamed protein product [Closterium sp. NIES-53]